MKIRNAHVLWAFLYPRGKNEKKNRDKKDRTIFIYYTDHTDPGTVCSRFGVDFDHTGVYEI